MSGVRKSKLELAVLEHRNNKKGRQQTIREFCKESGFKEPTYYKLWSHPASISDKSFIKLANVLNKDIEKVKLLSQEYYHPEVSEENIAIIEENIAIPLKRKSRKKIFVVSGLILSAFISGLVLSPMANIRNVEHQSAYRATFKGSGVDLSTSDFSQLKNFHSKLYKYEMENIKATTIAEDIRIEADLTWISINDPKHKKKGKFIAKGDSLGDQVALVYRITDTPDNKVWIGSMMLDMPYGSPVSGFWLTTHKDKDLDSAGLFAVGTIEMQRVLNTAE